MRPQKGRFFREHFRTIDYLCTAKTGKHGNKLRHTYNKYGTRGFPSAAHFSRVAAHFSPISIVLTINKCSIHERKCLLEEEQIFKTARCCKGLFPSLGIKIGRLPSFEQHQGEPKLLGSRVTWLFSRNTNRCCSKQHAEFG